MKYDDIEKDVLWVLKYYGSNAQEQKEAGSKARTQAKRIAEYIRQWDVVYDFVKSNHLDLISLTSRTH